MVSTDRVLERVAGIEPVSFSLEGCLVTMTLPAFMLVRVERFELPTYPPQTDRSGQAELHSDETLLRGLNPRAGEERE